MSAGVKAENRKLHINARVKLKSNKVYTSVFRACVQSGMSSMLVTVTSVVAFNLRRYALDAL